MTTVYTFPPYRFQFLVNFFSLRLFSRTSVVDENFERWKKPFWKSCSIFSHRWFWKILSFLLEPSRFSNEVNRSKGLSLSSSAPPSECTQREFHLETRISTMLRIKYTVRIFIPSRLVISAISILSFPFFPYCAPFVFLFFSSSEKYSALRPFRDIFLGICAAWIHFLLLSDRTIDKYT